MSKKTVRVIDLIGASMLQKIESLEIKVILVESYLRNNEQDVLKSKKYER